MKKVFSVGICIFLMLSAAFAAGFVPVGEDFILIFNRSIDKGGR